MAVASFILKLIQRAANRFLVVLCVTGTSMLIASPTQATTITLTNSTPASFPATVDLPRNAATVGKRITAWTEGKLTFQVDYNGRDSTVSIFAVMPSDSGEAVN